ncbi:hypothetical protein KP509_32G069300 [Ceratopteris richardii]|uniref:TOD1/MUCI70 glycosyltransferase-like domain-containing protein n=1 Tax=Ceratopteris richardii TaxID=49495 RepID=A0A8T2QUA1_CERRI|nr:hypothetical protein KP509_32G069300 [Ceratopteris richardii]
MVILVKVSNFLLLQLTKNELGRAVSIKLSFISACPVCYLPVKKAISEMHISSTMDLPIHRLSYLEESSEFEHEEGMTATSFGGHPSLEDRKDSYQIHKNMKIHCGFAQGIKPGSRSGFDIQEADWDDMKSCTGVVVASAIFGNYDRLKQPVNVSKESSKRVCFFMFVDEETHQHLDTYEIEHGIWRVVIVRNLAYEDARRNGKIPKLLLHRLFPNAKFSLWIDGKLKLVVDPYQVLERFLWRRNVNIALSRHYRRFDVFVEAEANKAARKYDNATIDAQIAFYQSEGLVPYNRKKSLFPSDVPEGCVIIREHTPVTNLFMCLWFNEVDRFTSRDQLSFAAVRDKLIGKIPLRLSMFLDCERRNFVVQEYHRDILEQRSISLMHSAVRSTDPTFLTSKRHRRSSNRQKIGSESIAAAM